MILPEGHFDEVNKPQRPKRTPRDRMVAGIGGVVTALVVVLMVVALTSHQAKAGRGCLQFNYTMATGGEQFQSCGAAARRYCAKPPTLSALAHDFNVKLREACEEAKLPYKTAG